jgi:serine/threonine protein kinase
VRLERSTCIGHYTIEEPIGKGGMGEVYRARDTTLGRDVAIKVLSEEFSQDKERTKRFEREARLLAQLNHPNIATLHGLEEHEGQLFLVMEVVEGETLAERIACGPIPLDEARSLFIQIAEGLEAAHEKGIIHRDLKPANIKITPDGKVKILDFGLAKAFSPKQDDSAETSQAPTLTEGTALGAIMGTAAYMSPEQARGHPVDRRTDIWAFGCCFYEALTGKRPFEGTNVTDVLAAVVRAEPDWRRLEDKAPSRVVEVLELCLEKDRWERLQHMGDVRIALTRGPHDMDAVVARHRFRSSMAVALALASALTAAVLTSLVTTLRSPASNSVTRFTIEAPDEGMFDTPFPPILSRDGLHLVYGAAHRLYLRSMSSLESQPIPGSEGATYPFFSPDSRWIGFFADGGIYTTRLDRGVPVRIADVPGLSMGSSWGPGDTIVSSGVWFAGLTVFSAEGGSGRELTTVRRGEGEIDHRQPQWLPSGGSVLFTVGTVEGPMIAVASMQTGEHRRLFQGSAPQYFASGHLVYAQAGRLFVVPFDEASAEVRGAPVPVLEGVFSWMWSNVEVAHYSVSDSGSLVYLEGNHLSEYLRGRLVWVGRDGKATAFTEEDYRGVIYPRLSPDESRVAVSLQSDDGRSLWLYDAERGGSTRFTFEGAQFISSWNPDGRRLTYNSNRAGWGIISKRIEATNSGESLFLDDDWSWPGSWSPDGHALAFTRVSAETNADIWILPAQADAEPHPFVNSKFDEKAPVFSPDGRFVAYVSDESGHQEVYVRSYPEGAVQKLVSTDGGTEPVWAHSGKELFYRRGDELRVVDVELAPELVLGRPRTLFEGHFRSTMVGAPNYDVSLDDERFLMIEFTDDWPDRINVVVNWSRELETLEPMKR